MIGAGHMQGRDPEFDKKGYRLPEIRTELWQGWIYVTLNPDAASVAELLAELEPEVARFRLDKYIALAQQIIQLEHQLEAAHREFHGRATTCRSHTRRRSVLGSRWRRRRFPEKVHDAFTCQTFEKDENAKYGRAHKDNHHLDGNWRYTSFMPTVFPSHMYVLAPDHMWYLSLHPRGVDAVR